MSSELYTCGLMGGTSVPSFIQSRRSPAALDRVACKDGDLSWCLRGYPPATQEGRPLFDQ
jgi:hypothetical protein